MPFTSRRGGGFLYRPGVDLTNGGTIGGALTVSGALTASSTLDVTGVTSLASGVRITPETVQTDNYTVTSTDAIVIMNGSSKTATLSATPGTGQRVEIRNLHTTALTIARNGMNIDGLAANVTVPAGKGWVGIFNGTEWYTLSGNYKRRAWLFFSATTLTAGDTDRYLNPVGYSTTPAGISSTFYTIPFPSGNLITTQYQAGVAHSGGGAVTCAPRLNGAEQTTQKVSYTATTAYQRDTHATPLAYSQGDYLSCQMDHGGTGNVSFATVAFEFEFDQ
jgi:hypothetical protein